MGSELFPFAQCRDLLAKAIHATLSQHAVQLRTLENRKDVNAIALNIDAWQFGRVALSVRIDDDESKTENDPREWILASLLNSCNSPMLQTAGEELEKLGDKFNEQIGSLELGFLIAWAGAEALLDRSNVVMMKHLGFAAFQAEDRFAGNSFTYHLWHEFGSSGRMNFCNLVLARPLAARLLHGKASVPPADNPLRWNRPAVEDLHGIQPLVPPVAFNFRSGSPGVIYVHGGKDGKSMVWWADEKSDECRDIERFCAAGRWRSWRTAEEIGALVTQPGKYVLRLNGVGTLSMNRHYYLSPEPEPEPDEYHCTTTKDPAEAPTFESPEEIVRMTLELSAATKVYEDEDDEHEEQESETSEETEAVAIEDEEMSQEEAAAEQDSEDDDSEEDGSDDEDVDDEKSEEKADAEDPDDKLPVMYWEPVLQSWAIEQEEVWNEFEREDLAFCELADEEASNRGLKKEEEPETEQDEEDDDEQEESKDEEQDEDE